MNTGWPGIGHRRFAVNLVTYACFIARLGKVFQPDVFQFPRFNCPEVSDVAVNAHQLIRWNLAAEVGTT
jgi:hypothetical protein